MVSTIFYTCTEKSLRKNCICNNAETKLNDSSHLTEWYYLSHMCYINIWLKIFDLNYNQWRNYGGAAGAADPDAGLEMAQKLGIINDEE